MGLQFANANDYLETGTFTVPQAAGTLAIHVYAMRTQADNLYYTWLTMFGDNTSQIPQFVAFHYLNNSLYFGWLDPSVNDYRVAVLTANYTLTQYVWHHFILTWDDTANETKLYLNGTLLGTVSTLITWDTSTKTLRFGKDTTTAAATDASLSYIADTCFVNRVWSVGERAMFDGNFSPLCFPRNMTNCWTLRNASAHGMADLSGGKNLTVSGPSVTGYPRVFYPRGVSL